MPYDSVPSGCTLKLEPYKAHASDQALSDFKQLLKLSPIGPKTYENLQEDRFFGISYKWLSEAKEHWETKHDFRKVENHINSFPNYHVQIEDIDVQFIALFSKKSDAVPIVLLHGWPGSIIEFLGTLDILKSKYSEDDLPYQVIVPSLPGYGYSSGPPLDRDYKCEDTARVIDQLMKGLGFESGYVAQGGDIGSFITRLLGAKYDSCKAAHLNLAIGLEDSQEGLTAQEKKQLERNYDFALMGNAYSKEHGTRPATVGLVLSASPIALLAWIGEKFLVWSDDDPPIDQTLDNVTLYWLTDSFPRSIYPYRQFFGNNPTFFHNDPDLHITKPLGYSYFPEELAPIPVSWVAKTGNLVWSRVHTSGGHFAAMEKPKEFVEDIEDFIAQVWKK